METQDPSSSNDARETLRQLAADEDAVRYPPLPGWFFAAMAALVAGVNLAHLLPKSDSPKALLALSLVAVVLGCRYWLNRDGVSWVSPKLRDMVPFLAGLLGTMAVCWAIAEYADATWIWMVGAVICAAIVLRTGQTYRREFGSAS